MNSQTQVEISALIRSEFIHETFHIYNRQLRLVHLQFGSSIGAVGSGGSCQKE